METKSLRKHNKAFYKSEHKGVILIADSIVSSLQWVGAGRFVSVRKEKALPFSLKQVCFVLVSFPTDIRKEAALHHHAVLRKQMLTA